MVPRTFTMVSAAVILGVVAFQACSGGNGDSTSPAPSLKIELSAAQVPANGTTVDVIVTATEVDGRLGEGTVELTVSAGLLDGQKSITSTLANGSATTHWNCDAKTYSSCIGNHKVTGEWKTALGSARIQFQKVTGTSDETDTDEETPQEESSPEGNTVTITASRNPILFKVGDYSDISAVLLNREKKPVANEALTFTSSLGGFAPIDSSDEPKASLIATTNQAGETILRFKETGEKGKATIKASHQSGAFDSLKLDISSVQQISWVATTCTGKDCTIMGVKGSGFNEQARVTFQVVDSSGEPAPGVKVSFSIPGDTPLGTTVEQSGTSDEQGQVVANVSAGRSVGAFTILAKAVNSKGDTLTETVSPTIGIRGAKAANFGFKLYCSPANVPALVTPLPPASIDVTCSVKLVDRFNNPVGGTSVNFKTEAGTIPNDISTVEYKAGTNNSLEGTATIMFNTFSSRLPDDVPPLLDDPNQYPYSRAKEPSVKVGQYITKNPRDGLVTIIAYVRGEEYYWDLNQNGIYDAKEPFIDQGEPFVDNNDNGEFDLEIGELFVDSNANGKYDGPDNVWSANTTIWTETRVIYTGLPETSGVYMSTRQFGIIPSPFAAPCDNGLLPGGIAPIGTWFYDEHLNRLAPGTSFASKYTGKKGSLSFDPTGNLADGFGIAMNQQLLSSAGNSECKPLESSWCRWKWRIYGYAGGVSGGAGSVNGEEPSSVPGTLLCAEGVVTISVTVNQITTDFKSQGGIKYSAK